MFKTKIYAGIAIIVAFGVLAMFHIYRNLDTVAGYLATMDHVSVPFSIAAMEMEKNTGEYANGVLRYVRDPDPALRTEAEHDIKDFNERHTIYMQLSTNGHERALGRLVQAEHHKLTAAGNALMDERDRLDMIFQHTADLLEQIDEVVDGPMLVAIPREPLARSTVLLVLQNIEAETAEIGFWLSLFKNRPTPLARKRLLEKVREQHDATSDLHRLALGPAARKLETTLQDFQRQVAANVKKLLVGESNLSVHALQLDQLANAIDGIFDKEIQVMLTDDLSEPHANANLAIAHVQDTLRYIIPVYFFIAAAIGMLLILSIVRPLKRLAAGTAALGAGNLDYRIDAPCNDEFGKLARQFNRMAARLQESTVSRHLLEGSEQQLQQTVAELRQEIAERHQAEQDREILQVQLRRSETMAAMGQLVAGVAHEVRNPLFGISSTLDAMEANEQVDRTNSRYWEILRREADRLNKLMKDLLEFGRTPHAAHTAHGLGRTLAEAVRNCHAAAEAAGISLVNRASVDAMVKMNRDSLLQVHINLLENAVQHAPRGSEVVVTTCATTDTAGRHWIGYSVSDAGPGFAFEDLPHIFEPFFTRRRKGTGLGLAIVRRIVEEHHGSIEARNRAEGGALVTVHLPVAKTKT